MPNSTAAALLRDPRGPHAVGARAARREQRPEPVRRFPEEFVRRPALVQRLVAAREASLALIVAPPGYGKTTLLTEWAEQDERSFIWVGCGGRSAASFDTAAAAILAARGRATRNEGKKFVLVVDDAHLVEPK